MRAIYDHTSKYERCADQSADVAVSIQQKVGPKDYKLKVVGNNASWYWPGHYWVEATSVLATDPAIIIDPLHDTITTTAGKP